MIILPVSGPALAQVRLLRLAGALGKCAVNLCQYDHVIDIIIRSKSLGSSHSHGSRMWNDGLTFEIDSENAILNCALELWRLGPLAFQINALAVVDSAWCDDTLPKFSVTDVCPSSHANFLKSWLSLRKCWPLPWHWHHLSSWYWVMTQFLCVTTFVVKSQDSDSLDYFMVCDNSDLQMAFWWQKVVHSGYLLVWSSFIVMLSMIRWFPICN